MDSFEKFNQTELPAKEHFYSILNDKHITNDEYDHAKKFRRLLKLRQWVNTMTYTLEVMCSWLADVFESFRKTCLQYYSLDPCHYFTSPGLSWDAMLKMTKLN